MMANTTGRLGAVNTLIKVRIESGQFLINSKPGDNPGADANRIDKAFEHDLEEGDVGGTVADGGEEEVF